MIRRCLRALLVGAVALVAAACAPSRLHVPIAPPTPRLEAKTPTPGPGHDWMPGRWTFDLAREVWIWMGGEWIPIPKGKKAYVPGRWLRRGTTWIWRPGRWRE